MDSARNYETSLFETESRPSKNTETRPQYVVWRPDSLQHIVMSQRRPDSLQHIVMSQLRPDSLQHIVMSQRRQDSLQHIVMSQRRALNFNTFLSSYFTSAYKTFIKEPVINQSTIQSVDQINRLPLSLEGNFGPVQPDLSFPGQEETN